MLVVLNDCKKKMCINVLKQLFFFKINFSGRSFRENSNLYFFFSKDTRAPALSPFHLSIPCPLLSTRYLTWLLSIRNGSNENQLSLGSGAAQYMKNLSSQYQQAQYAYRKELQKNYIPCATCLCFA